MSELHSVPTDGGSNDDKNMLVIKEWKFHESDAINGIWGIAKALDTQLVYLKDDEEISQCLAIALVNLATQLKLSL